MDAANLQTMQVRAAAPYTQILLHDFVEGLAVRKLQLTDQPGRAKAAVQRSCVGSSNCVGSLHARQNDEVWQAEPEAGHRNTEAIMMASTKDSG